MTKGMAPLDEAVGFELSDRAGDAIRKPEHFHLGGKARARMDWRWTANVVADGAGAVELAVAARIGDDREQLVSGRVDFDRAADLVRSGINSGDGRGSALHVGGDFEASPARAAAAPSARGATAPR